MSIEKLDITGLYRTELADKLKEIGIETFRAKQIWHWEGSYALAAK